MDKLIVKLTIDLNLNSNIVFSTDPTSSNVKDENPILANCKIH